MGVFDYLLGAIIQPAGLIDFIPQTELIEDAIRWADEKYNVVCNNKQTAVAVLYLQGISVYRSLIVDENGTQCRYDDPRKISDNYFSIELPQNEIENLRRDRYIIIKKY